MIREACRKLHETGVTPEQFSWAKRAVYGRTLAMLNNTESIANAMVSQYFAGYSLFDYIDRAAEVTLEQVNARLEEQLDDSRCALSVILPQE
jgi:predicted Zn-dependent peptidase